MYSEADRQSGEGLESDRQTEKANERVFFREASSKSLLNTQRGPIRRASGPENEETEAGVGDYGRRGMDGKVRMVCRSAEGRERSPVTGS